MLCDEKNFLTADFQKIYCRQNYWCSQDDDLVAAMVRSLGSTAPTSPTRQIPKLFHFIWLGSPLCDSHTAMINTWREVNPDWEVHLWGDADVDSFLTDESRRAYYSSSNFGMMSDILRYEILREMGGVYIDIDYQALRPISHLTARCTLLLGVSNAAVLEINNGIMGSVPHHPLLSILLSTIHHKADYSTECISLDPSQAALQVIASTGPGLLTKAVFDWLIGCRSIAGDDPCCDFEIDSELDAGADNDDSVVMTLDEAIDSCLIVPTTVFHCVPNSVHVNIDDSDTRQSLIGRYSSEYSVCVHWWQKSWQKATS